jgi:hypothetical protein
MRRHIHAQGFDDASQHQNDARRLAIGAKGPAPRLLEI